MIKNIIFDMGNVLLEFNPELIMNQFFDTEEEKDWIRKELFEGPDWVAGDYGTITNKERYERVKERVPQNLHHKLFQCVEHWHDYLYEVEGAKEFVKKRKQERFRIFVLSNACSAFYEYFPRFLPLDYFDGIVVSSDEHMIKPDERIYKLLMDRYQLEPDECLFLDDRPENVEAAKALGMQGAVFHRDYGSLTKLLFMEKR